MLYSHANVITVDPSTTWSTNSERGAVDHGRGQLRSPQVAAGAVLTETEGSPAGGVVSIMEDR
ncbi:hypothetical protein GB937_002930 [Aspergillus fischeri]|nr:hypothetical protein GB937_002930 [Aspergillus fischeri]